MLKTILKTSGLIACLLAAGVANATGLGGIVVSSNLGQPLRAEIELVSVDKADRSSIAAKLAAAEAFKSAGIEYPYALPRLKFDIVARDTDQPRIRITSTQPINEPFVTLLVEVVWSSGKLLREYTFLLDPVGYDVPAQPAAVISPVAPVVPAVVEAAPPGQTVEPAIPVMPNETAAVAESAPAVSAAGTGETIAEQPEAEIPVQASVEKVEPSPAESVAVQEDGLSKEESIPLAETPSASIAVVRGDTLSKIALKTRPADVSLERMLVALYRANTGAFMGKNMNRLQVGKVIRLPDATEIEAIDQKEAVQEYRAQVADWNAYRQQLAAARGEAGEQAAQQSASGKVTASVAESAPAAKETAKEVLKLSKGEVPGDKAVGGKSSSKEEDAIAREKSLQDAQERTALLEKNVKDLQRLADLKKQQAVTPGVADSAAAAATAAGAAPAVVKPSAKPAVPAPFPVSEKPAPSFLDELLDDPVLLGGGAAVVLLLGGGFWLSRRRTIRPAKTGLTEDAGGATGRITAPVMPSPETGDFTQGATEESTKEKSADEVDPIAEADLFLSFGRDTQAEEVLKDALSGKPGDLPIILKLLSIYANRKDASAFFAYASQVKENGDASAWEQVAGMGRALEPNNPLYGGAGESASEQSAAPENAADPAVDFDLGFGGQWQPADFLNTLAMGGTETAGHGAKAEPENLFDALSNKTPQQESTTILSADELRAAQDMAMDFDVTGTQPQAVAATTAEPGSVSADDLIFDVTATHPGMSASAADGGKSGAVQQDAEDLIFDVTSTKPGIAEMGTSAPAADDSLAFTLDIPDDFKQAAKTETEAPMDIGLGEISLNLGGTAAATNAGAAGAKDERWQEVATKLDLAKAYQEMGDAAGAREILDEVLRDGDAQQQASAQAMLAQL